MGGAVACAVALAPGLRSASAADELKLSAPLADLAVRRGGGRCAPGGGNGGRADLRAARAAARLGGLSWSLVATSSQFDNRRPPS